MIDTLEGKDPKFQEFSPTNSKTPVKVYGNGEPYRVEVKVSKDHEGKSQAVWDFYDYNGKYITDNLMVDDNWGWLEFVRRE